MNATATVGVIHHFVRGSDLVGLGLNWGKPSDSSLRNQYTTELFYRIQIAQNLAITPSIQLLINPELNPEKGTLWVGGIRARFTL